MGIATSIFNINTGNPAELNARSFASQILRRFPNGSAPMFALTSQTGKSAAKQSQHGYFTKVMVFHVMTQSGANITSDTVLNWVATAGLVAGMLFTNVRTREVVRVTVVANPNVTVTRAFGRIAAAAINDADKWIHSGTAFEEASNRPVSRRLTTQYIANYTQIFRNAWAITNTAKASMAEMGISNIQENRNDCAMFHSVDMESAIIYGQPLMDTSGSTPIHATQGVIDAVYQYAPGNVAAAASTTGFDQLVAMVDPCFQYASNLGDPRTRIGYCDATALRVLNQIGRASGQITITQAETQFGMRFTQFQFYKGTINLVEHPLLNGLAQTGMMLIADMPSLKLAYLGDRDTIPEEYNFATPADSGQDASGGSLLTECAVEMINPFTWGLITGLNQGVA